MHVPSRHSHHEPRTEPPAPAKAMIRRGAVGGYPCL
jgi:hypothetical protein